MIKNFTILGERCSGTNFLERIIKKSTNIPVTWVYGWKHFYGFESYENSDDVLFIGIVRDPMDWILSFWRRKWHIPPELKTSIHTFLTKEWWSNFDKHSGPYSIKSGCEIMEDRNMHTNERYQNIFEMRKIKAEYLLDYMSSKVKNFILIRYEDLCADIHAVLTKINEQFNVPIYPNKVVKRSNAKHHTMSPEIKKIFCDNIDHETEKRLGYMLN